MTALPYPLAKALKDAGWPQPQFNGGDCWTYDLDVSPDDRSECLAYSPSLEGLIEACLKSSANEHPFSLMRIDSTWIAGYWFGTGPCERPNFSEQGDEGATPSEAVANLWLALRKEGLV